MADSFRIYEVSKPMNGVVTVNAEHVSYALAHFPVIEASITGTATQAINGMPVVPPTKLKAKKFLGYSAYAYQDTVATVNGRAVKAYQVAANAIMAGCAPEHLPICMAFAEALEDDDYLNSLRAGQCTPMLYVNGPVARQIGVDNAQGMTTEECNIGIGRFI